MTEQALKIAYGIWTYAKDFEETKLCIERVSPNVDVTIVNYNPVNNEIVNDIDGKNVEWLENNKNKYNLNIIYSKFNDNFPEQRNVYLNKAKELNVDWLCVSDNDELYSEELAKNLRILINKYDNDDYQNLAVPVRDQFTSVDWLDKLDLLKEVPAGYQETNYYKPMLIFKLFPDIRYEGVGVEKNVHETLITQHKRRTLNLPKEYYYIHKKSSLKIWRNAARNMFISGGGDNVGNKNKLWTELRQWCSSVGINNWTEFEKFVELGINNYLNKNYKLKDVEYINNVFRLLLEAMLKSLPSKEGTENRELAKWYFALHKEEVNQRIEDLIKKIPELTKETEIENFVTQMYYKILGRHPDETGKQVYVQDILSGKIKRTDLIDVFRNSEEYQEKFGSLSIMEFEYLKRKYHTEMKLTEKDNNIDIKYDKLKYKKIENFVSKMYLRILGREPDDAGKSYYTKAIMEKIIKASDLSDIFVNSDEYKDKFSTPFIMNILNKERSLSSITSSNSTIQTRNQSHYSKSGNLKVNKLNLKHQKTDISKHNTVSLCIMGFKKGIPLIRESILTIGNKVDEIHIQGDDFDTQDIQELQNLSSSIGKQPDTIQIHIEPWIDDFSDYKNKALSYSKTEWNLILDHDEVPTEELAKELKNIIKSSNIGNNYDMVNFDVIDITTVNGKVIFQHRNRGGKALLHWNIPYPYYGNPHIWLRQNYYPWKEIHSETAYKHIKEHGTELERSVRNVFMGGGGDNSKEKNPNWIKLRKLTDELKINTYSQFDEYLKKENINRKLLDIIIDLSEMEWKDNELKDILRYYILLHPEEEDYVENKEYRQKKFGDTISWEEHVNEVLKEKVIYYPYDSNDERVKIMHKYKLPNLDNNNPNEQMKVLDAGCFIGRFMDIIKGAGYDYTGVDQSQLAIDTAKKFHPNDKFVQNFLWNLTTIFEENTFDIIFMNAVLQHNTHEEKERIIPELFKVLKYNGIYITSESTVAEDTKTQLTHENWIKMIEKYGFKFLESFHKNELNVDDTYIFLKP